MENSNSFFSNSVKTFDDSQNTINPMKNQFKKSIKHFSQINNINLNFNKNNSSSNIFFDKIAYTSLAKNSVEIKNMYNKLTPSCLRKNKKFGNFYIFGKRELAFDKSMKEGKLVFKYHQSIGMEKKRKSIKIKKYTNSLYLTESMSKSTQNKTTLPLIDKDKSLLEEDKSFSISKNKNKNVSFSRNININKSNITKTLSYKDEEINSIDVDHNISNFNSTKIKTNKSQKGIKILKKLNFRKNKQKKNLEKKDLTDHSSILKKQEILNKSALGIKSLNKYVQDFRDIISDKYTLNIKKEKVKVLNENINNKIAKVEDHIKDMEANSKLFLDEFYPKFKEYTIFRKSKRIRKTKKFGLYE